MLHPSRTETQTTDDLDEACIVWLEVIIHTAKLYVPFWNGHFFRRNSNFNNTDITSMVFPSPNTLTSPNQQYHKENVCVSYRLDLGHNNCILQNMFSKCDFSIRVATDFMRKTHDLLKKQFPQHVHDVVISKF